MFKKIFKSIKGWIKPEWIEIEYKDGRFVPVEEQK